MKTQKLRIIGGRYKRRTISFASIEGLRPTPDRLRETLFNWLMHDISDANVLDVCAGSGALSLECLSRGAKHVTLIEPNRKQVGYLKQALDLLNCEDTATVVSQKAEVALKRLQKKTPYDVVFIDPPYSLGLWNALLSVLFHEGLVKADSLIYIEAHKAHHELAIAPHIMEKLCCIKEAKVGQIHASLYRVIT